VLVQRGSLTESRHIVHAVICDSAGKIVNSWGDIDSPVYLRSAIKPLQALPLIESGAADAFGVTDRELSLACASHTGEPVHVEAVTAWLKRIGLTVADLECGSHWPTYAPAAHALAAQGRLPTAVHNNCSGKHAGFLTTCLHLEENHRQYIDLQHPVQQRLVRVLEDFTGLDLSDAPVGIDGCSIPTIAVPLSRAALAIARFAVPAKMPAERVRACQRLQQAIAGSPEMIAGSDRLCTALNRSAGGTVIAKVGAEGVYLAALPQSGLGIALKTADGATRGAEVALGAILESLGAMTEPMHQEMDAFVHPIARNWNGMNTGIIRAEFAKVV
jgi:L-asparaginase II